MPELVFGRFLEIVQMLSVTVCFIVGDSGMSAFIADGTGFACRREATRGLRERGEGGLI